MGTPKVSEHRTRGPLVAVHRLLFRKERQGARFIVLTEGPVHFSVEERSPGALVLTLENAHIPLATNRLPLETRFFGASVTRIRPENQAKSAQVRIHIALEGEVAYRVRQHSQGLEVDFMPPEGRLAADFQLAGARP